MAGVGPSGVGASKESPTTSSSRGWFTEPSASEGELDIPVMEVIRMDEVLPEVASEASPTTAKVSFMEPVGISVAAVAEAVKVVPPLGNTLTICKQPFLDIIISYFNKVLLQLFYL